VTPVVNLPLLQRRAAVRLALLQSFVVNLTPATASAHDHHVAFVTIEAMSLWSSFVRTYYLSWFLRPRTVSGARISTAVNYPRFTDALVFAIQKLKNRSYQNPRPSRLDEPPWHQPRTLLTLATALGVSNLSQVQAALSTGATYLENLPALRNFYAHRNDETYRRVQRSAVILGLGITLRSCQVLCTNLPSRPQNLICDWFDEIRFTIDLLCA
jgi:hypothetical protein